MVIGGRWSFEGGGHLREVLIREASIRRCSLEIGTP